MWEAHMGRCFISILPSPFSIFFLIFPPINDVHNNRSFKRNKIKQVMDMVSQNLEMKNELTRYLLDDNNFMHTKLINAHSHILLFIKSIKKMVQTISIDEVIQPGTRTHTQHNINKTHKLTFNIIAYLMHLHISSHLILLRLIKTCHSTFLRLPYEMALTVIWVVVSTLHLSMITGFADDGGGFPHVHLRRLCLKTEE